MSQDKAVDMIAILLIVLFTYTASNKLLDHETFFSQLKQSPYLTRQAGIMSWLVPAMELCAAGLLAIQKSKSAGFYLSFFLMLLFTGYIYLILQNDNFIPCSCGGVIAAMNWKQHLLFNITFTSLSLAGVLLQPPGPERISAREALTS